MNKLLFSAVLLAATASTMISTAATASNVELPQATNETRTDPKQEHGRYQTWYADGRPQRLEYKDQGKPIGPQLGWNENGSLERFEWAGTQHTPEPNPTTTSDAGDDPSAWTLDLLEEWSAAGTNAPEAHRLFWRAVLLAKSGDHEAALEEVAASFEAGYPTPMDAIGLGVLSALTDDPVTRPLLIQLWVDHARERSVTMVSPTEPGTAFRLSVKLIDAVTRKPLPGAVFGMHHTDDEGYYFHEENSNYNVRLSSATRTDENGEVSVRSILPGYYTAEYDSSGTAPRHIHFSTWIDGDHRFWGEAEFDDDPRINRDERGVLRIHMLEPESGVLRGKLVIAVPR